MKKIIEKIRLAKSGDDNAMIEIIEQFTPIIDKYTRLMNYDEDCRSELVLKLIALVKNEIDTEKMQNTGDGAIVNYITHAIRHHYIAFSKAFCRKRDNEIVYDRDIFVELLEDNLQTPENMDNGLMMEMLRSNLTNREYMCVRLIVLEGWTAEQVAARFDVTKQAINQCKIRALAKVKKMLTGDG